MKQYIKGLLKSVKKIQMPEAIIPNSGEDGKLEVLNKIMDYFTADPNIICSYVKKLREQNSNISTDDLARKIVSRKAIKNGLVGAATGIGGFITMPVTVPADLVASWKIQITTALAIAYIYGHTSSTTDLKTDMFLILAGDSAKEALKRLGIEVGKELSKRAIERYVTKEVMIKISSMIGRKIITKAGEKSMTSFMKAVPLIGAPVGFAFDWTATRALGHFAIKYYSGKA
jgi:hypothetical protein